MTRGKKKKKINYSIGQKVKVVKHILSNNTSSLIGKIGTITAIETGRFPIRIWFDDWGSNYFEEEELEGM